MDIPLILNRRHCHCAAVYSILHRTKSCRLQSVGRTAQSKMASFNHGSHANLFLVLLAHKYIFNLRLNCMVPVYSKRQCLALRLKRKVYRTQKEEKINKISKERFVFMEGIVYDRMDVFSCLVFRALWKTVVIICISWMPLGLCISASAHVSDDYTVNDVNLWHTECDTQKKKKGKR